MENNRRLIDEDKIPNTIRDLESQIEVRRNLMRQMVGSLYPSIISDQIVRLVERLETEKEKLDQARYVIEE
jgi:hypothetical protein